jgi:hypothetical protein
MDDDRRQAATAEQYALISRMQQAAYTPTHAEKAADLERLDELHAILHPPEKPTPTPAAPGPRLLHPSGDFSIPEEDVAPWQATPRPAYRPLSPQQLGQILGIMSPWGVTHAVDLMKWKKIPR